MGAKGSKKKSRKSLGTLRVLILGNAGSGKSTFAKQMKLLHDGFSKPEIEQYRSILRQNLAIGLQEIIKISEKYSTTSISSTNRKKARYFVEHDLSEIHWDSSMVAKAKAIWNDPAVIEAFHLSSTLPVVIYQLEYLIHHIERITSKDFIPSNEDILISRQRTTGSYTTTFIKDKYTWNLIDVGGQKPERAKWEAIITEDDPSAIIFIAALDEYNVNSSEEPGSKLQVAIELFKSVMESINEHSGTVMLFLNKMDTFTRKINSKEGFIDFKHAFADYEGTAEPEKCAEHVYNSFLRACGDRLEDIELHQHYTCALDTEAMGSVFNAITKDLYVQRLAQIPL